MKIGRVIEFCATQKKRSKLCLVFVSVPSNKKLAFLLRSATGVGLTYAQLSFTHKKMIVFVKSVSNVM